MSTRSSTGDTVSEDAKLFLAKFLERETQQYSDFVALWNELNFHHLYWYSVFLSLIKAPHNYVRSTLLFVLGIS